MFAVPVGELLEGAAGLQDRGVVARARDKLQTDGQLFIREAAGDRESGESTEIANGSQRIGIGETLGDVGRNCNRRRRC